MIVEPSNGIQPKRFPVLHQVRKESRYIAGVHLTGMVRDAAGKVDSPQNVNAMSHHDLAGNGQFAIAAALGG